MRVRKPTVLLCASGTAVGGGIPYLATLLEVKRHTQIQQWRYPEWHE